MPLQNALVGTLLSRCQVIADFDQFESAYKARMEEIKTYMNHIKLNRAMQRKVRKFYSHYYSKPGVAKERWFELPPNLRRDVVRFENREIHETYALACSGTFWKLLVVIGGKTVGS